MPPAPAAPPPPPPDPPTEPAGLPYASATEAAGPPAEAFVPPELLARRRAAAPPSTPYQPIAGWSLAPSAPADPAATAAAGPPTPATAQPRPADPAGTPSPGPANGFAAARAGASAHAGPASGASGPAASRSGGIPAGGGRARPPMWVLGVVGLAVVAVIAVVGILLRENGEEKTPPPVAAVKPTTAAPEKLKLDVLNFDPKGEGFRDKGKTWETSTYNTVDFGNLKEGVGLILDLGSAKAVDTVSFTAETGPLQVELRTADEKPTKAEDWDAAVGESTSASGDSTLDGTKGGKHRYWMIWVTKLGPDRKAIISGVSATGS